MNLKGLSIQTAFGEKDGPLKGPSVTNWFLSNSFHPRANVRKYVHVRHQFPGPPVSLLLFELFKQYILSSFKFIMEFPSPFQGASSTVLSKTFRRYVQVIMLQGESRGFWVTVAS